jgi:hypothetical protein
LSTKGYAHEKKECRHCHEQIAIGALARHEKDCAKASPEQRQKQKRAREYAAQRADRQHTNRALVASKKSVANKRAYHRNGLFNGRNGRRLYATISVDFKTLRTLILDLAPSLSIDKVEIL